MRLGLVTVWVPQQVFLVCREEAIELKFRDYNMLISLADRQSGNLQNKGKSLLGLLTTNFLTS